MPAADLDSLVYVSSAVRLLNPAEIEYLLTREAIGERQFGDWSMTYQTRDAQDYVGSPEERGLLEKQLKLPPTNPSTARIVLHSFWNRNNP